jgi:hypothetical protein
MREKNKKKKKLLVSPLPALRARSVPWKGCQTDRQTVRRDQRPATRREMVKALRRSARTQWHWPLAYHQHIPLTGQ